MSAKYILYNRLEDILCNVGTNCKLKINLNLYKNNVKTNEKEYYLKEVRYISPRDNQINKKIIRSLTDGYLSLENTNSQESKVYIILTGKDLEYIRIFLFPKLEYIVQNYNKIFELRKDNKIYINENFEKLIEIQLPSSKCILWFKPGLFKKINEEIIPCLEMYMNSQYIMTSISFPNLYEFMYILRTIQIQTYLSSMLSYLEKPTTEELEHENAILYFNYQQSLENKENKGFFAQQLQERKNK